jgi:hypothetical protein
MGGTLHCDRGNTRRILLTTRQENGERREQPMECRATTAVLCIEGIWRQETFELWPSEPRTRGHRSGSLGQLDNMYEYSSFHSGAQTLELYENKINKLLRFGICGYLRHITRLFTTWYLTKINTVQGNSIIYQKNTPERRFVPMVY